ncbi:MAG: hypothetical protein ACU837_16680 [Gammaproteobacteria bacterium]
MIHHLSIAARQPQHVAQVVAELIGGKMFPFPPVPGSFVAVCEDEYATMVEVYPDGTVMLPGDDTQQVQSAHVAQASPYVATHAAFSVAVDEARIKEIGKREGWRAVTCDRGGLFQVVEFWLENRIMFELLTPDMARDYLKAMTPENWTRYIELGLD